MMFCDCRGRASSFVILSALRSSKITNRQSLFENPTRGVQPSLVLVLVLLLVIVIDRGCIRLRSRSCLRLLFQPSLVLLLVIVIDRGRLRLRSRSCAVVPFSLRPLFYRRQGFMLSLPRNVQSDGSGNSITITITNTITSRNWRRSK